MASGNFVITNARNHAGNRLDLEIRDGIIDRVVPAGDGSPAAFDADNQYDAEERLVTSSLTEVHTHLDTNLIAGTKHENQSGTLSEARALCADLQTRDTKREIKQRARNVISWFNANGITKVRTHVDTSYEGLLGVKALVELREEVRDYVDLQLVALPSAGVFSSVGAEDRFLEAIEMGVDLVGGSIPRSTHTREYGVEEIQFLTKVAEREGLGLDVHIDETDDPNSRFTEVLAREAMEQGIGAETTASHATAMHSYADEYADRLIGLLEESGVNVITNPLTNAVLQGRHDAYPRRRGHTRVDELLEGGVTVGVGQDDLLNPYYHYGDGDPLTALFMLAHFAHMNGMGDVKTLWDMQLSANASIFGDDEFSISEGNEGSVVVYDCSDPFTALRLQPPRALVLKEGSPIARTTPAKTTIMHQDGGENIDFKT